MNAQNDQGPQSRVELQEPQTPQEPPASSARTATSPIATRSKLRSQRITENRVILIAGSAIAAALLLFLFASRPQTKQPPRQQHQGTVKHRIDTSHAEESSPDQRSLFPVIEAESPKTAPMDALVGEKDVAQTATPRLSEKDDNTRTPQNGTLGAIPPFDVQGAWEPVPYEGRSNSAQPATEGTGNDHPQASLIFVRKAVQTSASATNSATQLVLEPHMALGLPVGTRLRARLESAASTAVKAPVIAIIEYNYERNGDIVVPAGTKAFGEIQQTDRSGFMSIRFDSLLMPDGTRSEIQAVATDLNLGPLRGKVEGKHSEKNVLIRSLSGVGEVGALLIGRSGSINQPLSEGDMLRERISANVGESADQSVLRVAATEHTTVTIFADTPIYLILERSPKPIFPSKQAPDPDRQTPSVSTDSARQWLQLQRELTQSLENANY